MNIIKTTKKMDKMISHSVELIVVKVRSKEVLKYAGIDHIRDYRVVRETREEVDELLVNVE